jgi:cytosine/adenosine deaminase-related metal-dependent hydrolase
MSVLIRDCEAVATMDGAVTERAGGSILIEDGTVAWVGAGRPPAGDAEVVDGRGLVAIPGLINTHHHLYQTMTRTWAPESESVRLASDAVPGVAGLDAEWVNAAALVGLAELALSGCPTSSDHHYVFSRGTGDLLGAEIDAVANIGVRLDCSPRGVRHLFVEGLAAVRDGRLANADEERVAAEGHRMGQRIAERSAVGSPT